MRNLAGVGNVTSDLIKQWCQDALHKKSLRATRNLLKVGYRHLCHWHPDPEQHTQYANVEQRLSVRVSAALGNDVAV